MTRFQIVLLTATLIDLATSALVLRRVTGRNRLNAGTPPRLGVADVLVVVAAGTISFAVKLPVLVALGVGLFGVLHLVYADLAISAPVLAVLTVWWTRAGHVQRARATAPVRALSLLCLAAAPVAVYASFVEPHRLQLRRAEVIFDRTGEHDGSIKVVVLSDFQFSRVTSYEREVVRRALAQRPDLILMPGDVLQGGAAVYMSQAADTHDLLAQLTAPGGVFLVMGDVDRLGWLRKLVAGTRVRLLLNDVVLTQVGDLSVAVGGIQTRYRSLGAGRTVTTLEQTPADLRILLSHRPDIALELTADSPIDMVIAGHTHGGQVQIPGFGPLITATRVPRAVAAGGLHDLNGRPIYVSRGIGMERGQAPPIRLFCRPELTVLTLHVE